MTDPRNDLQLLSQGAGRIDIRRPSDFRFHGQQTLRFHDIGHAHFFLQRHYRDCSALFQLRGLLAGEVYLPGRLDDHSVMHEIAARLASGRLVAVLTQALPRHSGAVVSGQAALPAARSSTAHQSKGSARAADRPAFQPARRPVAPPPPAVEAPPPELHDNVDQDAQAEALEKAALAGTPFCAVCEQARASRGQAVPA